MLEINDQQPIKGPDQVMPADKLWTTDLDGCVKIREIAGVDYKLQSIPSLLMKAAENDPDLKCWAYKENPVDKEFKFITLREQLHMVKTAAKAFIELGLERNKGVIIVGRNCPQWIVSFLGGIFAGGYSGGLYETNGTKACLDALSKVEAEIIVVENGFQLEKILKIKQDVPSVKAIIQFDGNPVSNDVLSWSDLLHMGSALDDGPLNGRLSGIAVNQVAAVLFTSGTTGMSKAGMLSHDNLSCEGLTVAKTFHLTRNDSIVSFLPLCHAAGLIFDVCAQLHVPFTVYFANKEALRGSIFETIKEVRPTLLLSVPRIAEKLSEMVKMQYISAGNLYDWALTIAEDKVRGNPVSSVATVVAKMLVYRKIKKMLGFDRVRTYLVGAAVVATDVKKWLLAADITLYECFGMTELSGMGTSSSSEKFNILSCGCALPGIRTKIHNPDSSGEGEVCFYGRVVFMGYAKDEEKTRDAIDADGWLHSGDLGRLDDRGFLFISGRIKELLITSGGETVAPLYYENNVKKELQFLSQAMMVGDQRKYLTILLTLGCLVNPGTGMPSDDLNELSSKWIRDLGLSFTKVSEVLDSGPHPKVLEYIQRAIDKCNDIAISRSQRVQKFAILPTDFSSATGELSPTMKLVRPFVVQKYKETIEKLYE